VPDVIWGHIKATFKSTGWECMDCTYFDQDNDQWRAYCVQENETSNCIKPRVGMVAT
jgi:hypothetical protein